MKVYATVSLTPGELGDVQKVRRALVLYFDRAVGENLFGIRAELAERRRITLNFCLDVLPVDKPIRLAEQMRKDRDRE